MMLVQVIYRIFSSRKVQQVKPFSLHLSLLIFVFLYASFGGFVMQRLEYSAMLNQKNDEARRHRSCVEKILIDVTGNVSVVNNNETIEVIAECFRVIEDERSNWNMVTGTLYGFGIITTLGYNRIEPKTLESRLFCVVYGIIGIPITMIIIANIGQYLNQFAGDTRKMLESHLERKRRGSKASSVPNDDIPDMTTELMAVGLFVSFIIYTCIGAIMLPLLNGEFDFFNGIYYNFLCLTAIDFGQLVPIKYVYLPITFMYVCVGLAITTIAIDVGSEYVKKLHYFGKRVRNVATTKVWFGGKTMKVKELLHAVGKKCGVDPYMIDRMDLENIVERVVAIREGQEPPPDLNEDFVSQKPNSPFSTETSDDEEEKSHNDHPPTPPSTQPPLEFIIKQPISQTISSNSTSDFNPSTFDVSNFVAIDMEMSDDFANERALNWEVPVVIGRSDEQFVKCDDLTLPEQLRFDTPVILVDTRNNEPRLFKEKKKKYGRDPKRLHATYQEEWERLERLGTKRFGTTGTRRKSLLALQDSIVGTAQARKTQPQVKKKRHITKKHLSQNGDVALTTPMIESPTNMSCLEKPISCSPPPTTNILSMESRGTVHRLSIEPLVDARERSPSVSSRAQERHKSHKLSPLLLKKFDLNTAENETSGLSTPSIRRVSSASKRVIMTIPMGEPMDNEILEAHVNIDAASLRRSHSGSSADLEFTPGITPDDVSNSVMTGETQPANAESTYAEVQSRIFDDPDSRR